MDASRSADKPSGIPLGRVFGFPLRLSPSWLILAGLVTLVYGQIVGRERPALSPAAAYLVGFGFVLCLLVSVLLHELGHAFSSRRYGLGVRVITLEMLGGYTEMEREAPRPSVELVVSLAGPAVSLALGVIAGLASVVLPDGTLLRQLAIELALSNIVVAVFNALPGLPLDGGRALQAAVWAATGDVNRGRVVAGWAGRLVAAASLTVALLLYTAGSFTLLGTGFILMISITIWYGAGQALRHARLTARLPDLDLDRLVRPIFAVPGGMPLAEAERLAAESHLPRPVLGVVDLEGRLESVVSAVASDAVPADRRAWIVVAALARQLDPAHVLPGGLRGTDLLRAVQADPAGDYLVVTGEDVHGVLRGADLVQLLEPERLAARRNVP